MTHLLTSPHIHIPGRPSVIVGIGRAGRLVLGRAEARQALARQVGHQWVHGGDDHVETEVELQAVQQQGLWEISCVRSPTNEPGKKPFK